MKNGRTTAAKSGSASQAAAEVRAHQLAQFLQHKGGHGALALRLQAARAASAHEGLDIGPAEGAQVVAGGFGPVGMAEQVALHRQGFRVVDPQEHLVGQAQRQAGGGLDLAGQGG